MRNLRLAILLVGISILALLDFRLIPGPFFRDQEIFSGISSYLVLILVSYGAINLLGLPTLEYFGWPKFNTKTFFAIIVFAPFILHPFLTGRLEAKKLSIAIPGIVFLLCIGIGEEFFCRGIVYGLLKKHDRRYAIYISSFLFGLMHLNLYTGKYWDPWAAYWHVISAFGFGLTACALMLVTRSIWIAALFHAIRDVGVVFEKPQDASDSGDISIGFWDGLSMPFGQLVGDIVFVAILLWMKRGPTMPKWLLRICIRLKLIYDPSIPRIHEG